MTSQRAANFQGTQNRRFGVITEHQRAAVAGRHAQEFAFCFGLSELLGSPNNLLQRIELSALLVNRQLRIADNVNEENMSDLQLNL